MLLVEGSGSGIRQVLAGLPGWVADEEAVVPVPTTGRRWRRARRSRSPSALAVGSAVSPGVARVEVQPPVPGEPGQRQPRAPGGGDRQGCGRRFTGTSAEKPAAHAFCTISKLARLVTASARSYAGTRSSSSNRPITLSTAL